MNETLHIIANRRSQRVYADKPISEAEKEAILHYALRAPTAGNMMLYSILEVSDPAKKKRLVTTCDNQPFIAKAPLVLMFMADMQRWYDYYAHCKVPDLCRENRVDFVKPREADLLLANCDALIAAQNAVIAAESLGIGSCYIGDIVENIEIHREMFQLPAYVFPTIMVCFGHYKDSQRGRPVSSRFDKKYICFENTYRRLEPAEFTDMFSERDQKDCHGKNYLRNAVNFGQHNYLRKTGSSFSDEMRRSVKVALKSWGGE
ncbi:MAG: nitroreductase [Desulfobacteraceae bacterium]|nr:nitroreductase [Desulfobacteraceae bacterium]